MLFNAFFMEIAKYFFVREYTYINKNKIYQETCNFLLKTKMGNH